MARSRRKLGRRPEEVGGRVVEAVFVVPSSPTALGVPGGDGGVLGGGSLGGGGRRGKGKGKGKRGRGGGGGPAPIGGRGGRGGGRPSPTPGPAPVVAGQIIPRGSRTTGVVTAQTEAVTRLQHHHHHHK